MPSAPDTADADTLDPGEKLAPFFVDLSNNPAWNHARQAAHKHGLSLEQLQGLISDVNGPMFDEGMLSAPYDAGKEVKSFVTASGLDPKGTSAVLQATGLVALLIDETEFWF